MRRFMTADFCIYFYWSLGISKMLPENYEYARVTLFDRIYIVIWQPGQVGIGYYTE